jgi:hypothetical protein
VQLQLGVQVAYLTTNSVQSVFLESCDKFKARGDLEEVANMKNVPHWNFLPPCKFLDF